MWRAFVVSVTAVRPSILKILSEELNICSGVHIYTRLFHYDQVAAVGNITLIHLVAWAC